MTPYLFSLLLHWRLSKTWKYWQVQLWGGLICPFGDTNRKCLLLISERLCSHYTNYSVSVYVSVQYMHRHTFQYECNHSIFISTKIWWLHMLWNWCVEVVYICVQYIFSSVRCAVRPALACTLKRKWVTYVLKTTMNKKACFRKP